MAGGALVTPGPAGSVGRGRVNTATTADRWAGAGLVKTTGRSGLISHSGFGPSDWPIWTDFVGGNFRQRVLFFGKSYRENKNCSGSENTPKKL